MRYWILKLQPLIVWILPLALISNCDVMWAGPEVVFNPTLVNFGQVAVGDTLEKELVLANFGDTTLVIFGAGFASGSKSVFSISESTFQIPAGDSLSLAIRFSPSSPNDHIDALDFKTNLVLGDRALPRPVVLLKGFGFGPDIQVSPRHITFGSTEIGASSQSQVSVSNVGTDTLNILQVFLNDSRFEVDSEVFLIRPGEQDDWGLVYTPDSSRARVDTLWIRSDDFDEAKVFVVLEALETPVRSGNARLRLSRIDTIENPQQGDTLSVGLTLNLAGELVTGLEVFLGFDSTFFHPVISRAPALGVGLTEGRAMLVNRVEDGGTGNASVHFLVLFPPNHPIKNEGIIAQVDFIVTKPLLEQTSLRVLTHDPYRNSHYSTPEGTFFTLPAEDRLLFGNSPPTIKHFPMLSTMEDTAVSIGLIGMASDRESPEHELVWVFNDSEGLFTWQVDFVLVPNGSSIPVARIFPPENGFGTYLMTAVVADPAGARDSTVVVIKVESVNDPPMFPEYEAPFNKSTELSAPVEFRWSCNDPDLSDRLTYEFKIGTDSLSLIDSKQILTEASYTLVDLLPTTSYYWQIFARDAEGLVTPGQMWQFRTAPDHIPPKIVGSPSVLNTTDSSISISWTTDEPSQGQVKMGLVSDLSDSMDFDGILVEDFLKIHSALAIGLVPETTYFFGIIFNDVSGNRGWTEVFNFTTLPTPSLGDLDGDRKVGFPDFLIFTYAFGSLQGEDRYNREADLNENGEVTFLDFIIFSDLFGMDYNTSKLTGGAGP